MATLRRSPIFRLLLAAALGSIVLLTLIPGVALGLPLVAITRPTQGATVSGVIWIDVAFRSDSNRPISRLEVYIDDALAREMDLTTPMLEGRQSFNWDFSYAAATTHKISARAIDTANTAASASVSVQVQNAAVAGPDRIPPVVRIYYPGQGAKLHGLTEIRAEASDNVGVELIYFYIDGGLHKMMMNAPPYVDAWDTTRAADGNHVLEAVAVDAQENEARSAQVTVIVENHSMTTMNQGGGMHVEGTNPELPVGGFSTPGTPSVGSVPFAPSKSSTPPAPSLNPSAPPVVTLQPWEPSPLVVPENTGGPAPTKPHETSVAGTAAPRPSSQDGPMASGNSTLPSPTVGSSSPASAAAKLPDVAPLLPLTGPKIANIVPRAEGPGPVPSAPSSESLLTLGDPLAFSGVRTDQPSAAPAPTLSSRTSAAGLAKPGANASLPTASAASHSAPKAMAPTLTQERPALTSGTRMAATDTVSPLEAVTIPQTAPRTSEPRRVGITGNVNANATLAPALPNGSQLTPADRAPLKAAKTAAPADTVRVAVRPSLAPVQVVTPVGGPVAISSTQSMALQPVMSVVPDHRAALSGLVRTTAPVGSVNSAPQATRIATAVAPKPAAQIAAVTRPPVTVAPLTQAVLAEYRGSPVPASRMLAMLPSSNTGKITTSGKITAPDQLSAAVPVATAVVRDIKIVFDGEVLSLRTAPETRKGISLAPLREIFEKTDGVLYWLPVEKKVEAVNKDVRLKLSIGDPKVSVNGEAQTLQIAPYIKQGRTMVPLQFIADVLDVKIVFENGTGQILISSNQF